MMQRGHLTIREAAAALQLSEPRIHQLLADGELVGPELPLGRKRHSPGAPRVSEVSLERYLRARRQDRSASPSNSRTDSSRSPSSLRRTTDEASSARAAAQEMKVKLDAMRQELAAERARSRDLLEVTDQLIGLLRSAQSSADRADSVTDGYSRALTQLLTPDTPAGLAPEDEAT